jgi:hypothetical protein
MATFAGMHNAVLALWFYGVLDCAFHRQGTTPVGNATAFAGRVRCCAQASSGARQMLRTALCDVFGIDVPIILAPMGSCTSAEFAAAASNAGGLAASERWHAQPLLLSATLM